VPCTLSEDVFFYYETRNKKIVSVGEKLITKYLSSFNLIALVEHDFNHLVIMFRRKFDLLLLNDGVLIGESVKIEGDFNELTCFKL
jgi:hypothetical protein